MTDYIAQIEGDYYEGTNVKLRLMTPQPVILAFRIESELGRGVAERVFVEDYFNSGTRIRRGRVYIRSHGINWPPERISPRPLSTMSSLPGHPTVSLAPVNAAYTADEGQDVKRNAAVVLGDSSAESRWLVVMVERVVSYGLVVTLKVKTFLGVLPEVVPEAIPDDNRQDILLALDAVVESATIQAPQPVIDACRNAASHMISAKFPESNPDGKLDLGALVKWLIHQGKLKKCTDAADSILYLLEASTSHLVNQLHSRGKANAAAARGTRPVTQEDANLAVCAVAFLLQDFEWAERRAL